MISVDSIEWAWPWIFYLLPLPILAYLSLPRATIVLQRALRVPDVTPYKSLSSGSTKTGRGIISALLLLLMWACLVVAAARPQTFGEPLGVPITGRDLMLCIDISGSMNETDLYSGNLPATRMSVVKNVAQDFVSRRVGDRIGLIMFGTKAYVQSPLTHDHDSVQHFLSEARVGLAGRSTAIGDAIGLGVKRLRERPAEARVLVLLTDGENSEGAVDPLEAARLAADNNIRVHTIGVGSESSGSLLGRALGMRNSELDETTLKSIAEQTGGQYFRARDQRELEQIYRAIDKLEPTEMDDIEFRPLRELFAWPLGLGLLLNVIWVGLRRLMAGSARV